MRTYLLLALFLLGCMQQRAATAPQLPEKMTDAEWLASMRAAHPDWYSCTKDNDCLGVAGECGSSCRGEAINNKGYSDFAVAQSDFCTGSGRTIRQCPYTEITCADSICQIRYI